jgi:hypothetical protein
MTVGVRNSNGICRVDMVERVQVEVEFWQQINICVFAVAGMGSDDDRS